MNIDVLLYWNTVCCLTLKLNTTPWLNTRFILLFSFISLRGPCARGLNRPLTATTEFARATNVTTVLLTAGTNEPAKPLHISIFSIFIYFQFFFPACFFSLFILKIRTACAARGYWKLSMLFPMMSARGKLNFLNIAHSYIVPDVMPGSSYWYSH